MPKLGSNALRGEASNARRRASELRSVAAIRSVRGIMKEQAWVAVDLEDYLKDMVVDEDTEQIVVLTAAR